MKIIVDKIEKGPSHSLSKAELEVVFSTAPAEWMQGVKCVRFFNTRSTRRVAYLGYAGELRIYSRGHQKQLVLAAILRALALNFRYEGTPWWRLTSGDLKKLEPLIDPILQRILPQISVDSIQNISGPITFSGFKEMKFPSAS